LAEVEGMLHEEAVAISSAVAFNVPATRSHSHPSIECVRTSVSEEHASSSTMLKKFKPRETPSTVNMPGSLPVAPTVQSIIVNGVPIVNPELTAIIRNNAPSEMASPEDPDASCPTNGKVIPSGKARPCATCVPVVDYLAPTSHVWPTALQVLATTALTEVEGILSE
jgi:hypothetical protein